MSCFSELYARYTEKMWELCEQEAYDEERLSCSVEFPQTDDACMLCEKHCYYDGDGYSETCESEECRSLLAWYNAPTKEGGYKRRQWFKKHFGKRLWLVDKSMRGEAILVVMLLIEAQEKANSGKKNLRLAA